jgi:hypothetical protein
MKGSRMTQAEEFDAALCFQCQEVPPTTTYGFPVCQDCCDDLVELQADLERMEAADPARAEAGRKVEAAWDRFIGGEADV